MVVLLSCARVETTKWEIASVTREGDASAELRKSRGSDTRLQLSVIVSRVGLSSIYPLQQRMTPVQRDR